MDDSQIATLLAQPEPSAEVVGRGRRKLVAAMSPASRRHRHWVPIGTAVTGAAVAVVIGIATLGADTTAASARQVLVEAANTAGKVPQHRATYWHRRNEVRHGSYVTSADEIWWTTTGTCWIRQEMSKPVTACGRDSASWSVLPGLRIGDIARLPTEPDALRDRMVAADNGSDGQLVLTLTELVCGFPAPAGVRAAGFRALAEMRDVRQLPDNGGRKRIAVSAGADPLVISINPVTSDVVLSYDFTDSYGSGTAIMSGEWTDTLPH
ncbi:hypothetical protein [Fodinicola acaciae]|uniref:hypothetical protein n=1 Tax=Fodinicola acaciae TaxID=2681555 RepID=UPI0013D66C7D|nr:hypothetical protein [Fodinicola acaciae]